MSDTVSYSALFEAILSMDSYNRGYNGGMNITGTQIGSVTVVLDSGALGLKDGSDTRVDMADGFYAVAYKYANGTATIAYHGTDQFFTADGIGGDIPNAYGIGAGTIGAFASQGVDALNFYQAVVSALDVPANQLAPVTLTGHSLGGCLAGYVAAITNQNTNIFETMAYQPEGILVL